VYLFHELPAEAQRAAAAEMARVVKPGGIVVLTDSVQSGDRDAYQNLGNFGDFQGQFKCFLVGVLAGLLGDHAQALAQRCLPCCPQVA